MPYTKSKIQRICSPEFQYWEVVEININDTQSFEIHWSDDKKWPIAEVYEKEDANLIAYIFLFYNLMLNRLLRNRFTNCF